MSAMKCGVLVATALALSACGQGATDAKPPVPGPVATVTVTPATPSVPAGTTLQLQAVVQDAKGTTLTDRVVSWSSADTTIAKVSSTGLVTGAAMGQTTITASAEGKTGSAPATVTLGAPQVSLDTAYYIAADSAYLWGYVNGWGGQYQVLFQVSKNSSFSPQDSSGVATGTTTRDGWGWTYYDLAGSTTYYFRIVARNSVGSATSPARSFTTKPAGLPRIASERIDSVGPGNVRYTVEGGANGAPVQLTFQDGSSSTSFTDISGCDTLSLGLYSHYSWWCRSYGYRGSTTYWYRAVAKNSVGTTTGSVGSFTTLPAAVPDITNLTTDSLTSSKVILWGWIVPNGAEPTVYFQWGTSSGSLSNLDGCTQTIVLLSRWVGCRIPGLNAGTTYYWRINATNSAGTTTGTLKNLTTLTSSAIGAPVADAAGVPAAPAAGRAPVVAAVRAGAAARTTGAGGAEARKAAPAPAPRRR